MACWSACGDGGSAHQGLLPSAGLPAAGAPACTAPATAGPLCVGSNLTSARRPLRARVHVARATSALRNKPVLVAASTTPDAATAMRLTKVKSGTRVAGSTAQVTPSDV